jgi:short chain dehydrogenase
VPDYKTILITGGTDGIGRGLGLNCLRRGDRVAIVGRNAEKGGAFLEVAEALGAGDRASFIEADLSLVRENERVIDHVKGTFAAIDALVLGARHYRPRRIETEEGFEESFALLYLSRFVLSHGLLDPLEAADHPVVVNVAGPRTDLLFAKLGVAAPESNGSLLPWDDLQHEREYDGRAAMMQSGPQNDLLGVGFVERHPTVKTRYVLVHPGLTLTSFSGYDEEALAELETVRPFGKSVAEAVTPIVRIIDLPPAEPLSAFLEGEQVSIDHHTFAAGDAQRLRAATDELLARRFIL